MELRDVVRRRRMVRAYDPDRPVPRADLEDMLALAIRAPSAGHTQGWSFLVLDEPDTVAAYWDATVEAGTAGNGWLRRMRTAPCLVLCFSDRDAYLDRYAEPDKGWTDRDETRWPIPYWHVDTGMAVMILLLAAEDRGLAACFFGVEGARWDDVRRRFRVPGRLTPVGVVSLGHPAADVRSPSLQRGRRGLDEVLAYGSF